jgi:hypothetical protein
MRGRFSISWDATERAAAVAAVLGALVWIIVVITGFYRSLQDPPSLNTHAGTIDELLQHGARFAAAGTRGSTATSKFDHSAPFG